MRARDVGGGAAAVAPGNGEAGGGGGGTRREDGECGGPGPSGAGRSPPSRPQAQGGALHLKPRREWDGAQPDVWVLDWFRGAVGGPEGGPLEGDPAWGGRRGLHRVQS